MRFLGLFLMLCASSAHGQVVGWISCWHDAPGEKFGYIKVALMDGKTERRSKTMHFDKLKPGANALQMSSVTGPETITGMRLACEIIVPPGTGIKTEDSQYTLNWEKVINIPEGVKIEPALILTLQQRQDGWRAYIGKAP